MRRPKTINNTLLDAILKHNIEHLKKTGTKLNRRERRAAKKLRDRDIKRQEEERNAKPS